MFRQSCEAPHHDLANYLVSQLAYVAFHVGYVVCHCPLSNEVKLLDDEAVEVRLGFVRNVECVGNHTVDMGGGGDPSALGVAYGGRDDGMVWVIFVDLVAVDGSAVEERNIDDVEEEGVAAGDELADKVLFAEAAVGKVAEVIADTAVEEVTAGFDVVVTEAEIVVVEEATLVLVCVGVWAAETEVEAVVVFVVGTSTETTETSVSVTVSVESVGIAVTVSVIVVVVGGGVVDDEDDVELPPPPSMGTTEYVSRGRRAWNLPTWPTSSAIGRQSTGLHKAEKTMARSGTGKLKRRMLRKLETCRLLP